MMNMKNEQTGRSMVEMLGVLAIVGVLSVAGIAGYSKAMAKFKISKAMDQVSMTVANIRTAYSGQPSYDGLSNAQAISLKLVGQDMIVGNNIKSPYGNVTIAADTDTTSFTYKMEDVPTDACVAIATSDWGYGSGGLQKIKVGGQESTSIVTLSNASSYCAGTNGKVTLVWTYR